jgi:hypothetical protein
MPVTTRQGDDTSRSRHSSPRSINHCVLDIMDIMESEEYTHSSPSDNYWPNLGEFYVMYTSQKVVSVVSSVVKYSSVCCLM